MPRLLCYRWSTATQRKGCVIVVKIAVLGAGFAGSALDREPAGIGTSEVTVLPARVCSE